MSSNQNGLFARQEIYDSSSKVCAYELLYREGTSSSANINAEDESASEKATSSVISHLYTHLDYEMILGEYPAFINFSRKLLLDEIPLLLPKDKVVIEILENITIDQPLIDCIRSLREKGYRIALDDFVYHERYQPLIELADIIKLDILNLPRQGIVDLLGPLSHFKGQLLAEKVETREQFLICKELGFHLFQGFFLHRPDLVKGKKLSENKINLLKLLTDLNDPNISLNQVEEIVLQVPKLSYRILRLANSASLYAGKKIESLLDAMQQLGLIQIKDWICLLLLSSLDDAVPSILEKTLIRAKMCQSIAQQSGLACSHQAFTVGMLSTLDTLLNESMAILLSKISLNEELNEALLNYQGLLGSLLATVNQFEQGHFDSAANAAYSPQILQFAYLEGLAYARLVTNLLVC